MNFKLIFLTTVHQKTQKTLLKRIRSYLFKCSTRKHFFIHKPKYCIVNLSSDCGFYFKKKLPYTKKDAHFFWLFVPSLQFNFESFASSIDFQNKRLFSVCLCSGIPIAANNSMEERSKKPIIGINCTNIMNILLFFFGTTL